MVKILLPLALLAAACSAGGRGAATRQSTLSDFQQAAPLDAPPLPGFYDVKLCVVNADPTTRMATFMPPNPENATAPVAVAFNDMSGFANGDLVTLAPAARATSTGQPQVKVLEKNSPQCANYQRAGAHAHH